MQKDEDKLSGTTIFSIQSAPCGHAKKTQQQRQMIFANQIRTQNISAFQVFWRMLRFRFFSFRYSPSQRKPGFSKSVIFLNVPQKQQPNKVCLTGQTSPLKVFSTNFVDKKYKKNLHFSFQNKSE